MVDRDNLDLVRLDEPAARRLIERATELDARLASESTVADLREAARAAGISDEAFNRALTEVRQEARTAVPVATAVPARRSGRRVALAVIAVFLIGAGLLVFGRRVSPRSPVESESSVAPSNAPPAVRKPVTPQAYEKTAPATAPRTKTKVQR